jgi:hypothetical protein
MLILLRLPHLFVSTCGVLVLVALCATAARAQSLGISPAFVDAKVASGATYTRDYTVTNNSGTRLVIRCSVADYWYDERTNARVDGRPGTLPRSASSWVQFSPSEVVVEPHASAVVKAVITVPQSAAGGFYTVPVFDIEMADARTTRDGTASAAVAVNFRGLLMLSTAGNSEYNVEIMGGRITPPTLSSPLKIVLDVRNRSTAHVSLRGQFAILNSAGGFAGRGKIDEQRFMPGQRNELGTSWPGELAPGRYTAIITLTYERAGLEPTSLLYEQVFEVR